MNWRPLIRWEKPSYTTASTAKISWDSSLKEFAHLQVTVLLVVNFIGCMDVRLPDGISDFFPSQCS